MAITNINIDTTAGLNELRSMNSNKLNGGSGVTLTYKALTLLDSTEDADVYIATTGTYGLAVPIPESDAKYVMLIRNVGTSADKTVLIKAGNATYYGAPGNLTVVAAKAVAAVDGVSETGYKPTAICLDSARYMQMTGARKGCIVVLGASADVEVALIKLP